MKKIIALLVTLLIVVGTASAVEFTVGGKILGSGQYCGRNAYLSDGEYREGEHYAVGAGASVFSEIDFVKTGIFKFGVRPEVGFIIPLGDSLGPINVFSKYLYKWQLKVPLWFTISPTESFDIAAGLGASFPGLCGAIDLQAAFKAGPGKIIVNPSFSINMLDYKHLFATVGVGYQYTF